MWCSRNIITLSAQIVNIFIVCANTIHFAIIAYISTFTKEIDSPQDKSVDFNTLPLA